MHSKPWKTPKTKQGKRSLPLVILWMAISAPLLSLAIFFELILTGLLPSAANTVSLILIVILCVFAIVAMRTASKMPITNTVLPTVREMFDSTSALIACFGFLVVVSIMIHIRPFEPTPSEALFSNILSGVLLFAEPIAYSCAWAGFFLRKPMVIQVSTISGVAFVVVPIVLSVLTLAITTLA